MDILLLVICVLVLVGVGLLVRWTYPAPSNFQRGEAMRDETDWAEQRLDQLTRASLQRMRDIARDELRAPGRRDRA